MNAMTQIKPTAGKDAFHRERSQCIDAFAAIEACIAIILTQGGEKCSGEPLGAKLESLRKLKPNPRYSTEQKKIVDDVLTEISSLLPVRADVVHGRLELVLIDGANHVRFTNAVEAAKPFPVTRLLTFEQLRRLTTQAEGLARKLGSS